MKKLLLCTTAFVAAGAFAGGAFAQSANEPIKIGIGGYMRAAFGDLVSQGGAAKNHHFGNYIEEDGLIDFHGLTKLDNGLSVGMVAQFRTESASGATNDTVKRAYTRFLGSWGEFRIGDDDDARLHKNQIAPSAGTIFGVNSPFFAFNNSPVGTNSTNLPIDNKRAARLAYFTPTIAGFGFTASYAPESQKGLLTGGQSNGHGIGASLLSNNPGRNSQAWSVAGNYDNKFGDFRVIASAGISAARQEAPRVDATNGLTAATQANPLAWDAGLTVGYGPFQVGGSFEHVNNARTAVAAVNANNLNDNVFDAGVLYTVGPFSTSLDWSHGSYRGFGSVGGASVNTIGSVAGATGNASSSAIFNQYELILDYVLGPGISVAAEAEYDKYSSGVTPVSGFVATQNYHSLAFAVGSALTF